MTHVDPPPPDRNPVDWSPARYERFADERTQPFIDLLDLFEPVTGDGIRAVDLGCGTGALTTMAADRLGARDMVGVDNSPAMLAAAASIDDPRVRFVEGDIGPWTSDGDHDVVLANASLQWVPNHRSVLTRWTAALRPGGQLGVQVPSNAAMPSHRAAVRVAEREPYLSAFDGTPPVDPVAANVLAPETYAQLLYDLGFERQHVRLQVYPHVLPSSRHVVEWVRGTTLTRFEKLLEPAMYQQFVADYERELLAEVGEHEPFFFAFRRVLLWGRRP
jgi:trans-aconitate 2-methyltransferase